MLNAIRSKTASWLTKALFIVLVIAFGAWGIGDIFQNQGGQAQIIDINGKFRYSQQDFERDLRQSVENLNRTTGGQFTAQQFAALGGVEQIIRRTLNNGLLRVYAHELNLTVPTEEAIAAIHSERVFQNEQGQFDRARFELILAENRINEAAYVESIRTELRDQWVFDAYLAAINAPAPLLDRAYQHVAETRNIALLTIPATAMNVAPPSDEALGAYFNANKDRYKTPEFKSVQYAWLRPDDFAKSIAVSDEEIAQEYEVRKNEYQTPEKREIEQIVLPSADEAQKLSDEIKKGGNFAEIIARELKAKPVQLGKLSKEELPGALGDAAFAMKQDEISVPIQTPLGFHILHITGIEPGNVKPMESVKEELRQNVALTKAGDQLSELVNQMEDTLAGGASLKDAAAKVNVTVTDLDALDAEGNKADGSKTNLPAEALALIWGENTAGQAHQLADGSYFTFQIGQTIAPKEQALADVRDKVKADWLTEERQKQVLAKAQELGSSIKDKAGLDIAAKALNLVVTNHEKLTRATMGNQGLDNQLVEKVFDTQDGVAVSGATTGAGVIVLVTGRSEADKEAPEFDAFATQVKQSLKNDLAQSLGRALEKQYKVTVRRDLVERFLQ